jgi:hypothetical protein
MPSPSPAPGASKSRWLLLGASTLLVAGAALYLFLGTSELRYRADITFYVAMPTNLIYQVDFQQQLLGNDPAATLRVGPMTPIPGTAFTNAVTLTITTRGGTELEALRAASATADRLSQKLLQDYGGKSSLVQPPNSTRKYSLIGDFILPHWHALFGN